MNPDGEVLWTSGFPDMGFSFAPTGGAQSLDDGGLIVALNEGGSFGTDNLIQVVRFDSIGLAANEHHTALLPADVTISSVYPNPFNASTSICVHVAQTMSIELLIYDLMSRIVVLLAEQNVPPGEHTFSWSADQLASGTYFLRLNAGSTSVSKLLVLVK